MDLNDMRAFLAVVRTGGITTAADSLFISQSTISYRIKCLEKELNVTLIKRGQGMRSVELTAFGERLVPFAERWVALSQEIRNLQVERPRFELQIGSVDSVNLFILMPLYEMLSREYPSAKIRIRTQQSLEIYHMIENKELDAGFVLRTLVNSRFHLEPVFREKMFVIHKRGSRPIDRKICPQELDPRSELYIEWSPAFVQWHEMQWGASIPPYLWIDSVHLMNSFLSQPQFWGICPESVVAVMRKNVEIETLELTESPPDRFTYLVTHTEPRAAARENLALFRNMLNQYRQTLSFAARPD